MGGKNSRSGATEQSVRRPLCTALQKSKVGQNSGPLTEAPGQFASRVASDAGAFQLIAAQDFRGS